MTAAMTPLPYRVVARRIETADTVTLDLAPVGKAIRPLAPGQFAMIYAFGVGEVPISVSAGCGNGNVTHTLRAAGAVTSALHESRTGIVLGLRGPYGNGWNLPQPGTDVLLVAGGIGLAPLRPLLTHALEHRDQYRSVVLLVGARTPGDLIYADSYDEWRAHGADVRVTVDRADVSWTGSVGVVTRLLDEAVADPASTAAFVCGPEVMMRLTATGLSRLGVPAGAIQISLERNMRCGVAWCGHCQLGPWLVCRDGPVVTYDVAEPLMTVREL